MLLIAPLSSEWVMVLSFSFNKILFRRGFKKKWQNTNFRKLSFCAFVLLNKIDKLENDFFLSSLFADLTKRKILLSIVLETYRNDCYVFVWFQCVCVLSVKREKNGFQCKFILVINVSMMTFLYRFAKHKHDFVIKFDIESEIEREKDREKEWNY